MDVKQAKKILNNYKYNELIIQQRERHVENLKNRLKKFISRQNEITEMSKIKYDEGTIQDLVNEQTREEKQLIKDIKDKNCIEYLIGKMPQPSKTILFAKYILGKTCDEIARDLCYSPKRIYQLHKLAIDEFAKSYNEVDCKDSDERCITDNVHEY